MGKFGHAGISKVRASKSMVTVDRGAGEKLFFSIDALGQTPRFVLASAQAGIWNESDFTPHPAAHYERDWPQNAAQIHGSVNAYAMRVSFFDATSYTVKVELRDAANNTLKLLKDLDCTSQDSRDSFPIVLTVTVTP